jgi:hypothetical protein
MSLFSGPRQHAANPPESWEVVKVSGNGNYGWDLVAGPSRWTIDSFSTKKAAEAAKIEGYLVKLYEEEARWYAGKPVTNWRPYAEVAGETVTTVYLINYDNGVDDAGTLPWEYEDREKAEAEAEDFAAEQIESGNWDPEGGCEVIEQQVLRPPPNPYVTHPAR